jgi:hypothetical protein
MGVHPYLISNIQLNLRAGYAQEISSARKNLPGLQPALRLA